MTRTKMRKKKRPPKFRSRLAMESIFLQIAREAVEDAEIQEADYRVTQSVQAEVRMQDQAMTAIVVLVQALEAFINAGISSTGRNLMASR